MSAAPLVSIVVVTYNGQAHIGACLEALLADTASPPFEVWVVDNASTDASAAVAEQIARRTDRVTVRRNPVNRGYAGGVNTVLAEARGEFIAVLNPDCVVAPGWLTPLTAFLQAEPAAGAVCPLILLQGSDAINAAGQDVHVSGLGFNRLLWRPRAAAGERPTRVSGLHGAAFVIRRALLHQMGGWDERGFLYHEDVALSWRLQVMGYDLYCLPEAVVWHDYHLTMYPEKLFLLERNRWALLHTHLHRAARWQLAPWLAMTELLMWGYCLLRGPAFLRAKAASYAWVRGHQAQLREDQAAIDRGRRREDAAVLAGLRRNYNWDQFFSLGRERGVSRRQPAGGLPVSLDPPP